MNSNLFSLNWKDVLNSFILGFITIVLSGLLPILDSGTLPTWAVIQPILYTGLTVTIANLLRKYVTNSNNVIAPEPK